MEYDLFLQQKLNNYFFIYASQLWGGTTRVTELD